MFKHILLPTDGSELSEIVIQKSIQFAKDINATVTGLHVSPQYRALTYHAEMLEETRERFAEASKANAAHFLAVIEKAANEAGVVCDTVYVVNDHPYEAIIKAAEQKGCDLIMMASHGRRGMQSLLIGSETQKVLTHTRIPVLVYR